MSLVGKGLTAVSPTTKAIVQDDKSVYGQESMYCSYCSKGVTVALLAGSRLHSDLSLTAVTKQRDPDTGQHSLFFQVRQGFTYVLYTHGM